MTGQPHVWAISDDGRPVRMPDPTRLRPRTVGEILTDAAAQMNAADRRTDPRGYLAARRAREALRRAERRAERRARPRWRRWLGL